MHRLLSKRLTAYFLVAVFILMPLWLSAASSSSTFSIQTSVGEDTTPPTTPTLLSATPVSSTAITLTWSVSTDDFALGGYTLWRDAVPIATTTLTSYSDSGLTPSTTYSYFVRAFDWVNNVSTSSNTLATTTFDTPSTPPSATTSTSTRGTSASGRLTLRGTVAVVTAPTTAVLTFITNRPARTAVRWGRTTSYELGFTQTDRFREEHQTVITDLLPSAVYYYEIIAYNEANSIPQIIKQGTFTTKSGHGEVTVPNVSRLSAQVVGSAVSLTWSLPVVSYETTVRVVRSHLGFPLDQYDGMVVYQGIGSGFVDELALANLDRQYYTVFVVATDSGAQSSGAVVEARVLKVKTAEQAATTITLPELPALPEEVLLPLLDRQTIAVRQGSRTQTFADEAITLTPDEPFTLAIPVFALPERLKSIIVTLRDPTDHRQAYTFLLRRPAGSAYYETTLDALSVEGQSLLLVEIYDFEALVVGRYGRPVLFSSAPAREDTVFFPDRLLESRAWLWMLPLLVLSLLSYLLWRRFQYPQREDNSRTR